MTDAAVVAVVVIVGLAAAAAPFLLPWPWRLRWIITSEAVNPLIALANVRRHVQMTEVEVVGVDVVEGVVRVTAAGLEPLSAVLVGGPFSLDELATIEGWWAAGMPLLLISEGYGAAALHGPELVVSGLRYLARQT